jgi:hypothetical protein
MGEAKRRKKAGSYPTVAAATPALDIPALPETLDWGLANHTTYQALAGRFASMGVDCSQPAFHDSPAFLRAERQHAAILNDYARFVEARPYDQAYLRDAFNKITIAARVVSEAARLDGRKGLCVMASGVLSRILDAWGIWNYTPKATLTVTFPPDVSAAPRYFWVLDEGEFVAAHAFVVAPPFVVVDATVRYQQWSPPRLGGVLPTFVIQHAYQPYAWVADDLANSELRAMLDARGATMENFLRARHPAMLALMSQLPGRLVTYPGGELRYVITAVGGYQERLHELTHHVALNGELPTDLFAQCMAFYSPGASPVSVA